MLRYVQGGCRIGALLSALFIVGCAVETPQPQRSEQPPPPTPVIPIPLPLPPKTYSGSYPERLEAEARDKLSGTPVRVLRNGNTVKLIVPVNAAFTFNSSQLQARFFPVLDGIASLCGEYSQAMIAVKGFTDSTGSFDHNQTLSEQRASSVGSYLSRTVSPARIRTAGYGPRYPIADNGTDSGRMQNRRVEIDLVTTP